MPVTSLIDCGICDWIIIIKSFTDQMWSCLSLSLKDLIDRLGKWVNFLRSHNSPMKSSIDRSRTEKCDWNSKSGRNKGCLTLRIFKIGSDKIYDHFYYLLQRCTYVYRYMHKIILYGDEVVFYLNIRNQITRVNNCYCSGVVTLLWVIVCKDISYTVKLVYCWLMQMKMKTKKCPRGVTFTRSLSFETK